MFALPDSSQARNGMTRREALRLASFASLGASLSGLGRPSSKASTISPDISCIVIWLQGGMSHIDSFDPKPEAPSEFRGEFKAIDTNVPGIRISEALPKLARLQDKYTIVRSLDPRNGTHGVADAYMLSGRMFRPSEPLPSFGSVVSKLKGGRSGMPPYVQLGEALDHSFGAGLAGGLGREHDPIVLNGHGAESRRCPALGDSTQLRRVIETHREDPHLREGYGRNGLGERCLLARRLIESGVRFVTVTDSGWDTHSNQFVSLRHRLLPRLDTALSTLLQDLTDRGLLETTLVLTLSDFGRSPRINDTAGRDHWAHAGSALIAGGGLVGGEVWGETDAKGEAPFDSPCYPEDLATTLYHRLRIDPVLTSTTLVEPFATNQDHGRVIGSWI